MKARYRPTKSGVVVFIAILCLLTLGVALSATSFGVVYLLLTAATWLAFAACWWRSLQTSQQSRAAWRMFCFGILLWALGMSLSAWEDLSGYVSNEVPFFSDLLYLLYAFPVLLVITYPSETEIAPVSFWLDTIQALMTGCILYLALFDVLPFEGRPFQPLSQHRLVAVYDAENLVLVVLAGVRLAAGSRNRDRMRLLRILFAFLLVYLVCAALYNHQFLRRNDLIGLYDALPATPFLLLTATVLWPVTSGDDTRRKGSYSLAVWIDTISPAFYTFSLVAIGLTQVGRHYVLGVLAIVVAMTVYVVRMAMLQNRYARAQIELREAHDRLEVLTLTDPLTGIPNRRAFEQASDGEWRRAVRLQHPVAVLLIDIDYFKLLNDRDGHGAGDECLARVARALQGCVPRSGDLAARYGGEEFAAVLAATDTEGAYLVATRMREAVLDLSIPHETPSGAVLSLSIGVACCEPVEGGSIVELVETADRALYEAKRRGRNRVFAAPMGLSLDSAPAGDQRSGATATPTKESAQP